MKIVCEACQAKYSIADDKVRGKVFKIRCKKCSHVIVVRGTGEAASGASGEFASSPSSAPDLALDAGWHIVVDGEQVGPLSEGDIKSRLVRGEITPETYIWKEGLADWVKIATLAEFASEGEAASPFAGGEPGGLFANAPTSVSAAPTAMATATTSNGGGMFAAASGPASGGGGLFSSPTRPVSDDAATEVRGGAASVPSYGGGGGGGYDAPMAGMTGGQAAGGLTGQRHENSVLFSLSNLEALAKPSSAPLPATRASSPSTSTTTEGSGLIDIRAMANMTLGGQAAKAAEARASDLPAFSAPQFSPVAPVLLAPSSSAPKWFYPVMIGLAVVVAGLVLMSVSILSRSEQAAVVPPPVAPTAPVPGTATNPPPSTAVAAKPAGTTPPTTQPPAANEALPPREGAPGAAAKDPGDRPDRPASARSSRPGVASKRPAPRGGGDDPVSSRLSGAFAPAPKPAPEAAPRKPKDDIEALLEAAAGGKKSSAPRREVEEDAAPAGEKLPPLGREGIVKGMNSVLPKARECYAQFKVPGVANAKITVNPAGKVTAVTVSGKFAGTPSGNCVEGAIRGGRFERSSGLTFDYPVPLR